MDRVYSLSLDRSRLSGPTVGPSGALVPSLPPLLGASHLVLYRLLLFFNQYVSTITFISSLLLPSLPLLQLMKPAFMDHHSNVSLLNVCR